MFSCICSARIPSSTGTTHCIHDPHPGRNTSRHPAHPWLPLCLLHHWGTSPSVCHDRTLVLYPRPRGPSQLPAMEGPTSDIGSAETLELMTQPDDGLSVLCRVPSKCWLLRKGSSSSSMKAMDLRRPIESRGAHASPSSSIGSSMLQPGPVRVVNTRSGAVSKRYALNDQILPVG